MMHIKKAAMRITCRRLERPGMDGLIAVRGLIIWPYVNLVAAFDKDTRTV